MQRIAALALVAVLLGTSGCAIVAGGLAGGAVGYTAGASSKADDTSSEPEGEESQE